MYGFILSSQRFSTLAGYWCLWLYLLLLLSGLLICLVGLELTLFVYWIILIWFSSGAMKVELILESCSRKAALVGWAVASVDETVDQHRRCHGCTSAARLTLKAAWIPEALAFKTVALFDHLDVRRFGGSPFFGGSWRLGSLQNIAGCLGCVLASYSDCWGWCP